MPIEIEAKLKVDSLDQVRQGIVGTDARFLGQVQQEDDYYDDPNGIFSARDRCLRLRRESGSKGQRTILSYKGPRQPCTFKARDEIQVQIPDGQPIGQLLLAVGLHKALTVRKRRMLWQVGNCLVCLDEVEGLGGFVEIEGPDENSIANIQRLLGLEGLPHIPDSYASMLRATLRAKDRWIHTKEA